MSQEGRGCLVANQLGGSDKVVQCYEMDKTSIFMFEILEPVGSALGKYSI